MSTTITSSLIREATFDANSRTLTVVLNSGREYTYQGVDQSVYQGLVSADSAGRFFNKNIVGKFTTSS
tara:strand:- start:2861 stop:3064 length:204 start_codon:yes stop_codon:yes gene_type:complete